MQMKGRSYSAGDVYRLGFNGKEKDDEIKGEGNSYDYGARLYDPRIGKWWAVDPLAAKYPNLSTYNFCANNPIIYIDPDGKKIVYVIRNEQGEVIKKLTYKNGNFWHEDGSRYNPGNESLSKNLYQTLEVYRKIEKSGDKELINKLKTLETSEKTHYVEEAPSKGTGSSVRAYEGMKTVTEENEMIKNGEKIGTQTVLDFSNEAKENFKESSGVESTPFTTVVHEIQHQYDYDQGNMADDTGEHNAKNPAEIRAVNTENRARKLSGMEKRTTYGGNKIDSKKLE